jgi:RNA polymerase sigma factor (sigma-70 family)
LTIFQRNRALLERFREGDKGALSEVYYFYISDIETLIRSHSKASSLFLSRAYDRQQDLVQEIFMRAFSESARKGYDGLRPFKPYLMSIAKNIIIDYLRKLPREALGISLNDEDDAQFVAAFASGAISNTEDESSRESGVHWDRCLSASQKYVSSLDETQQKFVDLRFKQEMPQLSVAKSLKMTRWKVRALEKKIIDGLKKYLKRSKLFETEK